MTTDLTKFAKDNGLEYFMISFTDLFGGQRAKLVPARAIADMQEDGAGFAGFATWLDLTPAHPDMLAVPDPEAAIILLPATDGRSALHFCRTHHAAGIFLNMLHIRGLCL